MEALRADWLETVSRLDCLHGDATQDVFVRERRMIAVELVGRVEEEERHSRSAHNLNRKFEVILTWMRFGWR